MIITAIQGKDMRFTAMAEFQYGNSAAKDFPVKIGPQFMI